jgi:Ca2+/H+ antiporter
VLLDALGWIVLGLILGFGTMWGGLEFATTNHAPYNYLFEIYGTLILEFLVVIFIVALLVRIHQHRRKATVGDYWRILISLIICMVVGAIAFCMVDGLFTLVG